MVSRVYMICDRYESGYGHGIKNDGIDLSKAPHGDADLGEAYQIGYDFGLIKFNRHVTSKKPEKKKNNGIYCDIDMICQLRLSFTRFMQRFIEQSLRH